jgi:prevent-host-death family protein
MAAPYSDTLPHAKIRRLPAAERPGGGSTLSRQTRLAWKVLMTSPGSDHWQIQDAKQRFSEMIRAAESERPQVITRHGEDVAVVVNISEYRRLTRPSADLASILLGGPKLGDGTAEVFAEIEAGRKADFGRVIDLEAGT